MKRTQLWMVCCCLLICFLTILVIDGCSSKPELKAGMGGLIIIAQATQDSDLLTSTQFSQYQNSNLGSAESREMYDYALFNDLIVYVQNEMLPPEKKAAEITYGPQGLSSSIVGIAQGQALRFINQSDKEVALFGYREETEEELNDWPIIPPKTSVQWQIKSSGLIKVYIDGEEEVEFNLFMAPGQRVASLRTAESFTLAHIPPGVYQVGGWHKILPSKPLYVTVKSGVYERVELLFSVDALSRSR